MSHEEDNVYYLIEYRRDPYDTNDWSSLSSKKYSTKAHATRDMNAEKVYNKTYYEYRIVKVTQEIFEGY
mgnify:CR=1 FL=1